MSILERKDGEGRLNLGADDTVVVLPRVSEPSPSCALACRPPYLCARCADEIRAEAVSWLQGLADDYFGYNLLDVVAGMHVPEISILWRDPLGVVVFDDQSAQR